MENRYPDEQTTEISCYWNSHNYLIIYYDIPQSSYI